jgi:adenylate cyclase
VTAILIIGGVYLLLAIIAWYSRRVTMRAESAARAEHARSEALLTNLLPPAIAARLKRDRGAIAERHDDVAVVFADIVGFTEASAVMPPEDVVARLNLIFSTFDDLTERHGAEKIKTIGDAYMAAVGVPEPRTDHVEAAADLALSLRTATDELVAQLRAPLALRIGLHAGPVVAGVLGTSKLVYDLWGDTVNVASRMESTGEPGKIQITREVADRLRGGYAIAARGAHEVKGRGVLETFFLEAKVTPSR